MKYLLLVHHNEDRFKRMPESTKKDMLAESIQLCHQLADKKQYVHSFPLQPEANGKIVRVRDGKSTVTDGPFMESKEHLARLGLWYRRDRDDLRVIASTRWPLRRAIRLMKQGLAALELEPHPDQTWVGTAERGVEFLGYRLSRNG